MKTKTIRQSVTINAPTEEVYAYLTDSYKHSEFTGAPAKIIQKIGTKFMSYGGWITGVILDLIPGQKIIESWRAEDEKWPKKHYSKVAILLKKHRSGTQLSLIQTGIPESMYDYISRGWYDAYWIPMKKTLEGAH